MKLTKREQKMLVGTIFIAAAVLFLVYVYFPINKDINSLKIQSSEVSTKIQEAEQRQKSVVDLKKQISALQKEISTQYDDFMEIWDQPAILVYLESTIDKLGLKNSVEFLEPITINEIKSCDISLGLKTNYNNLVKLFKSLEKGKYFNIVSSIDITDSEDESPNPLEVNLVLRFYSQESIDTYPAEYSFMNGQYKKSNIFQ